MNTIQTTILSSIVFCLFIVLMIVRQERKRKERRIHQAALRRGAEFNRRMRGLDRPTPNLRLIK